MSVLPIYNTIAVPGATLYLRTDGYQQMTGKLARLDEKVTLIVARKKLVRQEVENDSFYPIGITGIISEVGNDGFMQVALRNRVNINEVVVYHDHTIDLDITKRLDIEDLDQDQADVRLRKIKDQVIRFSEGKQWAAVARGYLARWSTIGELAAGLSPWMVNSNKERYDVLAEDSVQKRFDMLEKMILENLHILDVNQEAKDAQEEEQEKQYREHAIRRQIDFLQKELDQLHPEEMFDLRKLEIKLDQLEMNDLAKKEGHKVLSRLKAEGQNSPEAGLLMDYMELLTDLPWKKEAMKDISLQRAEEILEEDHFGLEKVKKRIIQQLAVMSLKGAQSGSILLFVGAPGTGKTSIGQSIARALDREYIRVSLGGVRDEADIRGHRRTYIGAMPGRIIDAIHKSGVSNPVIVLDEVDKLASSYNGDPASALLEVLDPEQNAHFTDHYLNVPFDLSDVFFVCTANTVDTIPAPLLNRMEMIQFQGYTPIEKKEIALRHLLPKARKAVGLKEGELEIGEGVIERIISDYTRESGVRGLKKCLDMLCRSAAVEIVMKQAQTIEVTMDNLQTFMDRHPLHRKNVPETAKPGIVTGLAWTQVGGEILYIETMFTKGSGKIIVTGQLGDVMKESAQIAVSLVKNMFPEHAETFEKNDLHIHVPDGATPKDGPSAGITITTALSSLVTGKAVRPTFAMTGEVSLRGEVNPIGGLPEKLMAAQRAGVKTVFIPVDNEDDLVDVAAEVKEALEIVPVREVTDVLKKLGIKER